MVDIVLIRGGGDLASGVAIRLHRVGMRVVITELAQPLVIRRLVSFAEAIYQGESTVEGVTARRAQSVKDVLELLELQVIPVLIDPECKILGSIQSTHSSYRSAILIDARMLKRSPDLGINSAPMVIGLGPGFIAGENCHAVIETNRGHFLGRVIWEGSALPDTGVPEGFGDKYRNRVLRAPVEGNFHPRREICDKLEVGDLVAEVAGTPIFAPFKGVLRGLLHPGLYVRQGFKVGDLDPRDEPSYCRLVSDKSLAVAGGVLEAILSNAEIRSRFWE